MRDASPQPEAAAFSAVSRRAFCGAAAMLPQAALGPGLPGPAEGCLPLMVETLRACPDTVFCQACWDYLNAQMMSNTPIHVWLTRHWDRIRGLVEERPLPPETAEEVRIFGHCSDPERLKHRCGELRGGIMTMTYESFSRGLAVNLPAGELEALFEAMGRNVERALRIAECGGEPWLEQLRMIYPEAREDMPRFLRTLAQDEISRDFLISSFAKERAAAPLVRWVERAGGPAAERCLTRLKRLYLAEDEAYLEAVTFIRRECAPLATDPDGAIKRLDRGLEANTEGDAQRGREVPAILNRLDLIEKRLWAAEGFRLLGAADRRFYDTYARRAEVLGFQREALLEMRDGADLSSSAFPEPSAPPLQTRETGSRPLAAQLPAAT